MDDAVMTPQGTTHETLTTEAILDAFATAGRVLPRAALLQAAERWEEVGPALLALLQEAADGTKRSERTDAILFFGIYVMAQVRETRAFRLLCTIGAAGERLGQLIEDGITQDLSSILVRVYDGDPEPLRRLIEAADADEFARDAALGTLAWLTAKGLIKREETAHYLRDLFTTLKPQAECYVWVGWQQAIALLGLDDLVPLVKEAFGRGWIDGSILAPHHFQEDLRAAQQAITPTAMFADHVRDMARYDDVVALLSAWYAFHPASERKRQSGVASKVRQSEAPLRNPFRAVGRNDPCPCGSGKKFKKCCLNKAA